MPDTSAMASEARIHAELEAEILRHASDRLRYEAYAAAGMGDDALELYDAVSISEETLRSFGENLGWEVISRQAARQEAHRRLSEQAGREVRDAEDALAEVARAPGGNRRTHNEQQAVNELSVTADRARAVLAFLSNGGEPNTKVLYPLDPEV